MPCTRLLALRWHTASRADGSCGLLTAPQIQTIHIQQNHFLSCKKNANSHSMTDVAQKTNTTHFGFQTVDEDEKQEKVNEVFTGVAYRYDLMNDAMSFGLHHAWKDALIDKLRPTANMQLLDLAGGTGDITRRFLAMGGGEATISDINPAMLAQGRKRLLDAGYYDRLTFLEANAEALPLEDNSFDAVTIAFGIRNVTHIDKVLAEAFRVLRIGGQFLCLEFSHPTSAPLKRLYDFYSFKAIPRMGKLFAGDAAPYQYLVESIRQFPTQEKFTDMLKDAGFGNVTYTNLTGGVVAIHSGWKV